MPPSDQEPRYQLVDSNGNVVGSLFGDGTGNVVIANETDTQTTFDANGITTPALEADTARTANETDIAGSVINASNPNITKGSSDTVVTSTALGIAPMKVFVGGVDADASGRFFLEKLLATQNGAIKVTDTLTAANPASRTYSFSGDDLVLDLGTDGDGGSGDYSIKSSKVEL